MANCTVPNNIGGWGFTLPSETDVTVKFEVDATFLQGFAFEIGYQGDPPQVERCWTGSGNHKTIATDTFKTPNWGENGCFVTAWLWFDDGNGPKPPLHVKFHGDIASRKIRITTEDFNDGDDNDTIATYTW